MDKIKILHLEDNHDDSELIVREIESAGCEVDCTRVDNETDFINKLEQNKFDIILADYNLPAYDGLSALKFCSKKYPEIPFIIVSGTIGEENAVKLLKYGAVDYIMKHNLKRLVPAIEHALEEKKLKQQKLKAEKDLIHSEEKYRKIFNNIQDVFYQIDSQGLISEISPSVFRLAGYRREEIIGMPVSEFYFDNNERTFLLETVSKKGEVWDYEVRLKTKAGQVKYASLNAHLLFDSDGNQIGIEGSLRDIDERKHFEIELREAKVKAENADHLKTAFLHNISHEIRTPMNAIIGFSSLLCEPDISSESQSLFVETIQESSNQLLSIINDIVDISSIEANLIKKHVTEFNLNAALKSLHNQFMLKASEKNISFGFKAGLTGKKAIILTDGTKVIQIMSNLLSNALKFTKQGQIDYGYTLKEDQVEFYVSDTGIGIPHEQHSKIFESFYQIENTLAREFGGTGLGLSICKAYSELLGGKLWLTSESEKGTTFFFSLPYRPVRPAAFQ